MTAQVVTVYTRPGCQPCAATKRDLRRLAIPFTEEPITEGQAEAARYLGITEAPIVCASTEHRGEEMWGGYRPDRISRLVYPVE